MTEQSYSEKLIQHLKDEEKEHFLMSDLENIIREFSRLQYNAKLENGVMPFGKYKFKKIKDVATFDRQYLDWLLTQKVMDNKPELRKQIIECF